MGAQIDALREQLVAQFGRKRASEIAVAAMGAGASSAPRAASPQRSGATSRGVLLRALLLTQASVKVWRKSTMVMGFAIWWSATRNQHSTALLASYASLQQDIGMCQHQMNAAANARAKLVDKSRGSGVQILDRFFAVAAAAGVRQQFRNLKQNWEEVSMDDE